MTRQEYYPAVQTHLLRSKHVAQTFKIEVMQPLQKRGETTRLPVVYATDGNFMFGALRDISCCIQSSPANAPRYILVGISYPGDCPDAGEVLRGRDMTFPGYPRFITTPPPIEGVLVPENGTKDFHGGEDFQRFIETELVPLIDKQYATLQGERVYFGHSLGGGFGLSTLFAKPGLFKRYIISSPSVLYHGATPAGVRYEQHDFLLQEARRFVACAKALRGTRLYMSVGSEEEFESALAPWQMTSSFFRLAALLRAADISGLELTTEVFAGETHASVWPTAFIHGVQAVFDTGPRKARK